MMSNIKILEPYVADGQFSDADEESPESRRELAIPGPSDSSDSEYETGASNQPEDLLNFIIARGNAISADQYDEQEEDSDYDEDEDFRPDVMRQLRAGTDSSHFIKATDRVRNA